MCYPHISANGARTPTRAAGVSTDCSQLRCPQLRVLTVRWVTKWLRGIDWRDVRRIEIVRVTLEGTPSCVVEAEYHFRLRDGRVVTRTLPVEPVIYETFVADVAALNRWLSR